MGRIPEGFRKASDGGHRKTISKEELVQKRTEFVQNEQAEKTKALAAQGTHIAPGINVRPTPQKSDIPGADKSDPAFKVNLSKKAPRPETPDARPGFTPFDYESADSMNEKARTLLSLPNMPPDQKKVLEEILSKEKDAKQK